MKYPTLEYVRCFGAIEPDRVGSGAVLGAALEAGNPQAIAAFIRLLSNPVPARDLSPRDPCPSCFRGGQCFWRLAR